ncbi:uncharacterized protein LOC126560364 [Anopheles maculipalpis]|uniref:uncharacterized protein LOC126560364 n=1 Tax=Anopheles maculipalpis TaxID=1496333 RepID=UPI002158D972|nr:uncharacterized protein LOC126560364 [Anopheles maculipalpis]
MSSQDNRYDKADPWKPHRNASYSSRDSPDRYRNRNDSKQYHYHKDRRYYDNRSWKDSSHAKRYPYDPYRYRYERKAESTDDNTNQHEAERTDVVPPADRGEKSFTSKTRWNSGKSPPPTAKRPSWLIEQRPLETAGGAYDPQASAQSATNFSLIFNHINTVYSQNDPTQPDRPMSFIDRLIADEAKRMLAAASSNKTTALNEPCETAETGSTHTVPAASEVTDTTIQQDPVKEGNDSKTASSVASVSVADSKLLQKSAEQVTKKLINQLSTMNKYDLKHMIDNPAGKYETALNRHAQNKLRAEVRKQLKSFGLNELGTSCVTGDGTVESDEAIDAEKIPSALLEQIEQALDLSFFDIEQHPEPNKPIQEQVSDRFRVSQSNNEEPVESITNVGQAVMASSEDTYNANRSIGDVSSFPSTTTSMKNGNDPKPATSIGRKKKIIIRKPANAASQVKKSTVAFPVQPNTFILRKGTIPCTDNVTLSPVPSVPSSPVTGTASKDTDTNGKRDAVEDTKQTSLEANAAPRNASFLRVSTVEELNRRLDGIHSTQSADSQLTDQELDPATTVSERMLLNDSPTPDASTNDNSHHPAPSCTVNGRKNVPGPKQNYRAVDISTVKVIGQSTITKEALLDYITNKKDGKQIHPFGTVAKEQTATSNFGTDQSKATHVPDTMPDRLSDGQFPARKGKSSRKRKLSRKKNFSSATVDANLTINDNNMANTGQEENPIKKFVKTNTPYPATAKKGKRWKKKNKPDRTEHSYCVVNVFQPSQGKTPPAPIGIAPEDTRSEDRLRNTCQDKLYEKVDDKETKNGNPQTSPKSHIIIANVCTMSGAMETSSSATIGDTASVEQELPQELSPIESSTSEPRDQHVQNATIPAAAGAESNLPDWNLMTEAPADSKEGIERIDSPQPAADEPTEEYVLGGDSDERCVGAFIQTTSPDRNALNIPLEQTAYDISNETSTPVPTSNNTINLQSLCAITEHMQSIETQTMQLYKRKMHIDAMFMTLQSERMEIDQQLERLHNIRSEQTNFLRLNLLELAASSSNGSDEGATTGSAATSSNGVATSQTVSHSGQPSSSGSKISPQIGVRQQERTIRRITPIGGNNVLMKIFQRRRAPSERSTEETSSIG